MCLGIPMKVVSCHEQLAICDRDGVQREVALHLINAEEVQTGDYLVVHLGFAIERIRQQDARAAETTWQEWREHTDKQRSATRQDHA